MKIVVVSPHPDDAEIGCGGMIHRRMIEGHDVTVAVCTGPGDLTMVHSKQSVTYDTRRQENIDAAVCLGSPELVWLDIAPASRFDQVPQMKFVAAFDQLFPQFDEVYLPLPSYMDDHVKVWEAGLAAFRLGKNARSSLYAYEQALGNCLPQRLDIAGHFGREYVLLSGDDVAAKKAALTCFDSQMNGRADTLYGPMGAELYARLRGAEVGAEFAEVVFMVRRVK